MKYFRLIHAVLGGALSMAICVPWPAHAALSDSKVCPKLSPEVSAPPGVQVPEVCYSGFNCTVGMRGDWLDITHEVKFVGSNNGDDIKAEVSIAARGDEIHASNACVPVSRRDREGYVAVLLEGIKGTGRGKAQVTAIRRSFAGVSLDSDFVNIKVRDGTHYLHPVQRAPLTARVGEVKTIDLTGRGLQDLRIKVRPPTTTAIAAKPAAARMASAVDNVRSIATPQQFLAMQMPPVAIVSKSYGRLSLRVNFDRQGTFSLADYVEFTVGDPAINRDLGWPSVEVRP